MEEHGGIFLKGFQRSGIAGSTSLIPNARKGSTAVMHVQGIGCGGVFTGIYVQDISWRIWLQGSVRRDLPAGNTTG
jgi:hypothetical protein